MPTEPASRPGPLHGFRIVDMTAVIAGPYATQIIADLGADVIKVEGKEGDLMRTTGPFSRHRDMATHYLNINRNKRSLALDLKHPSAKRVMDKLLVGADAFVTNVRPQGMARLGLDYAGVRALSPAIVYAHLVGYGTDGPYAGRQAYDDLIQAASGLADLLPKTDGDPTPRLLPTVVADKVTGLHLVYALLAALLHRERTGEGQYVEVPMFEAVTSFTLIEHLYGHIHVPPTGQWGYTRVLTKNRRPFKTKDAYIAIMPYTDKHWPRFFELAGHPELWERWRGSSRQDRALRIDELYTTVGELTQTRTTADWMELLDRHDIPCMRVNRLEDLPDDPHLRAVGFFETREHPTEAGYVTLRQPVSFEACDTPLRHHAPRLGADGRELLLELGLRVDEIEQMHAEGALVFPSEADVVKPDAP